MDWVEKVWGRTRHRADLSVHGVWSVHELEAIPGTFCSFHSHKFRANTFRVAEGGIRIVYTAGHSVVACYLSDGGEAVIPSGVAHQFQVLFPTKMFEFYHVDRLCGVLDDTDIQRYTTGGACDCTELGSEMGIRDTDGSIIREFDKVVF